MARRPEPITMDTSEGPAEATPKGPDRWLLSTPWGDQPFVGTAREARAALAAQVAHHDTEAAADDA